MNGCRPILGIVLLDNEDSVAGCSAEPASRSQMKSPWHLTNPESWSVSIHTVIAKGADSTSVLARESAADRGVVDAARRLDDHTHLIIGGCGFFWTARHELTGSIATPTILSGLDLMDLALAMTSRPIGVITYSEGVLERLLFDHPKRHRMRLVGLDDLSDWAALGATDYMERGGWTMDGLRSQLVERLSSELGEKGRLEGVGLLILECTGLPNFRSAMRSVTPLPILDVASFAAAALG